MSSDVEDGARPVRAPLVLKFGGAALASPLRIRAAVARIRWHRERDGAAVVVVSAPGATTDRILDRVRRAGGEAPGPGLERALRRERDRALATGEDRSASVLAAALLGAGIAARSLSGPEAGLRVLRTGDDATLEVDPAPLTALLAEGVIPVVSGFQARDGGGELATLERGGSDLTAVALAGALGSPLCLLVKDVPGVFDRDPALHPGGILLDRIRWDDLVKVAEGGARVIQLEAARRARRDRIPLHFVHYASRPGDRGGSRVDGGDEGSDVRSRPFVGEPALRTLRGVS